MKQSRASYSSRQRQLELRSLFAKKRSTGRSPPINNPQQPMESYLFISYRFRQGPEWQPNVRRIKKLLQVQYELLAENPFEALFGVSHIGIADDSRLLVAGAGTATNAVYLDDRELQAQPVPFDRVPAWTLNFRRWKHLSIFCAGEKIVFFADGEKEPVFEVKGFLHTLKLKAVGSVINHARGVCVAGDVLYFLDDRSSLRALQLQQVQAGAVQVRQVLADVVDFVLDALGNLFYIDCSDCLKKLNPKGAASAQAFRFDRGDSALVSTGLHCCAFRLVLACLRPTESDCRIRLFSLDNRLKLQHEYSYAVEDKAEFAMHLVSFQVKRASFLVVGRSSNWIDLFVFKGFQLHPVRLGLGQDGRKIESEIDGIVWRASSRRLLFTTRSLHAYKLAYD